ncbi:MAG: gamma-glutamyltransferase [Polyangiaceae bacterium]
MGERHRGLSLAPAAFRTLLVSILAASTPACARKAPEVQAPAADVDVAPPVDAGSPSWPSWSSVAAASLQKARAVALVKLENEEGLRRRVGDLNCQKPPSPRVLAVGARAERLPSNPAGRDARRGSSSGVVLNDELDDFTKQKDVAPIGMKESPNRPRPGARPVSSMTPTLVVKDGQVVLALGGSGGTAIGTNVTQLLLGRMAFGKSPAELVKAPRFYIPTQGSSILLEKGAAPALIQDLKWRGEAVGNMRFTSSGAQMIAIENGRKLPASDPRKHGSAKAE